MFLAVEFLTVSKFSEMNDLEGCIFVLFVEPFITVNSIAVLCPVCHISFYHGQENCNSRSSRRPIAISCPYCQTFTVLNRLPQFTGGKLFG
jgi:hypothetical protein